MTKTIFKEIYKEFFAYLFGLIVLKIRVSFLDALLVGAIITVVVVLGLKINRYYFNSGF